MTNGCPSPFLRSPYVFAFVHLSFLPAFALPCYIHRHHPEPGLPSSPAVAVAVAVMQAHQTKARAALSDQTSPSHTQMDIVITADNDCLTKTEARRRIRGRDSEAVAKRFSGYHLER